MICVEIRGQTDLWSNGGENIIGRLEHPLILSCVGTSPRLEKVKVFLKEILGSKK